MQEAWLQSSLMSRLMSTSLAWVQSLGVSFTCPCAKVESRRAEVLASQELQQRWALESAIPAPQGPFPGRGKGTARCVGWGLSSLRWGSPFVSAVTPGEHPCRGPGVAATAPKGGTRRSADGIAFHARPASRRRGTERNPQWAAAAGQGLSSRSAVTLSLLNHGEIPLTVTLLHVGLMLLTPLPHQSDWHPVTCWDVAWQADNRTCASCSTGMACTSFNMAKPGQLAGFWVEDKVLYRVWRCGSGAQCPSGPASSCGPNRINAPGCMSCLPGFSEKDPPTRCLSPWAVLFAHRISRNS